MSIEYKASEHASMSGGGILQFFPENTYSSTINTPLESIKNHQIHILQSWVIGEVFKLEVGL